MLRYGKTSQNALIAMGYLAEVYDGGVTKVSSRDIAKARNLPQPIVAKLLVVLSQAGLAMGTPGPHGGYWLAKSPAEIALSDIVSQFEKIDKRAICLFNASFCRGSEPSPCPLHEGLADIDRQLMNFLDNTTLAVFSRFRVAE